VKEPIMRFPILMPLLILSAAPALAEGIIDHASMDRAIESFTGSPIGVVGGARAAIDRRLRLAACGDVVINWRTPRQDTLVLTCREGPSWKLFVPVVVEGDPPKSAAAGGQGITRGDIVTVQVKGDGYSVSQGGEAMEDGAVGSWIKIKLPGKGDSLSAQVARPGLVVLPIG
jgi:flagella basal body P-ring formation protein FlgA